MTSFVEPILRFNDGSLILTGEAVRCPFFRLHGGKWRARPIDYTKIISWFQNRQIPIVDDAKKTEHLSLTFHLHHEERTYQQEAVEAWTAAAGRGCIVLPTGSGKTLVAVQAMRHISQSTLVVLPTIDLMNQWYDILTSAFRIPIGILGGGFHEIAPITVTTYDSAYRYVDLYGNRFALLVFDEVHHLPSESYSHIAEMSIAPYRLGLTATFQRTDVRESMLPALVGPVVYEKTISDFKGTVLADYEIQRLRVDLSPEERVRYEHAYHQYIGFVREKHLSLYGSGWTRFIKESVESKEGRQALLAKQTADKIASQASAKFETLELLLKLHANDRVLIFTRDVALTYEIARRYLMPAITHFTNTKERKDILDKFRKGAYRFLVSSEALNEGVDVPAANVGIIVSGTASPVRHLQRLGRLLRKKGNEKAMLYEIITSATREGMVARRRRQSEAFQEKP